MGGVGRINCRRETTEYEGNQRKGHIKIKLGPSLGNVSVEASRRKRWSEVIQKRKT